MTLEDDDFRAWLEELGLGRHAQAFQDNDIDHNVVHCLSDADLAELGLSLGHRRLLQGALRRLAPVDGRPATPADGPPVEDHGERRQVTVLFCDLVDSTALSNQVDVEELRKIIFRYCIRCCRIIKEFGGSDARVIGDGIQALFGYPKAHEDAAECAIHAALRIVDMMSREHLDKASPIGVRIGLATGIVVVSDMVGLGFAEHGAVTGPAPNLAARLQALTQDGTVVVADETRRLAGGFFVYADHGLHAAKGFDRPVQVWRVVGKAAPGPRFDSRHGAVNACVGRDPELRAMQACWAAVTPGRCHVAAIVGEAGIGKSRLLRGARELLPAPCTSLCWQCAPSQAMKPLHPVIDWLRRDLGIARSEPAADRARLQAWLGESADEVALSLLAELLAIALPEGFAAPRLPPDRKRDLIRDIVLRHVDRLCQASPVLLMVEDAHWMDATTESLLRSLSERLRKRPLMILVTARPEAPRRWLDAMDAQTITLEPLPRSEARQLVRNACHGRNLPSAILEAILDRTDGVPLFLEELTATILESGQLRAQDGDWVLDGPLREFEIPSTLRDSLMERLDRLTDIHEVARIGSALGREFAFALLARVSDQPAGRLIAALERLVQAGLLFQRGTPPESEYLFKHSLVQQAAYDSQLRSDRQLLHGRIVRAIETCQPDFARQEPGLMAHHCRSAGLVDQEVDYLHAAGVASTRIVAIPEALSYFARAEELVSALAPTACNVERHIAILLGLMDVGRFAILPSRLGALSERARSLAARPAMHCDATTMSTILFQDGRAKLYSSDYARARAVFREIQQLGFGSDSTPIERKPASAFSMCLCCQGLFNETLEFVNESNIGYYKASGAAIDYIAGLGWIAVANCQAGFIENGLRAGDLSVREAELVQSQIYLAGAHIWRSHAFMALRRFDEAVADAQHCVTVSEVHAVPYLGWHGLVFLALCQCRGGDTRAAGASLARARGLLSGIEDGVWSLLDYLPAIDAEIACCDGDHARALACADEAIAVASPIEGYFAEAMAWRVKAICTLRAGGEADAAQACFDRAMRRWERGNARAEEAFSALVWANELHRAGYESRARRWITAAKATASRHGFALDRCEHGAAAML